MKKSELTKAKLIKTAKELTIQNGYDLVTIRGISQKSSINVAAVSYYYSSKDNLMGEVLLLILEDLKLNLKKKLGKNFKLLSIDKVVEIIFDGLLEDINLYNNYKRMFLDTRIMNSPSITNQGNISLFHPGYSFIYDYLEALLSLLDKYPNETHQRISLHLFSIIENSIFLARDFDKDPIEYNQRLLFLKESLKRTSIELIERLELKHNFNKSVTPLEN